MNKFLNTSQMKAGATKVTASSWERPMSAPEVGSGRSAEDINAWWTLVDRVIDIATSAGWSKTEVARRIGMPDGTFSQWFSGKYTGRLDNQNRIVSHWLDAVEEQAGLAATIPTSPSFLKTRAATEIMETLQWAQMTADMVMITYVSGNGKTDACDHYRSTRPHVYRVTLTPHTKTVHGMLVELATELEVHEHNPAKLTRAIGRKLQRVGAGTLLIIDEAQNLVDDGINQVRHFMDVYKCGIALVGNTEVYGRFSKRGDGPSYAQLKSRVGKRLNREKPYPEDISLYIAAWGVTDQASVKLLTGIGMKGGALRSIDRTMKLASMYALGDGVPVTFDHIQAAWRNRDVEDLA